MGDTEIKVDIKEGMVYINNKYVGRYKRAYDIGEMVTRYIERECKHLFNM